MENRLTQAQLLRIVEEVERLSARKEAEFDREQVKQILQELNLPPEFLDEALIQLRRREALAVQQRRNRSIIGGVAATVAIVIFGTVFFSQQHQQAISAVSVQQDRITLVRDNGGNLSAIDRQTNPEIFYRVTLKNAPLGEKLSLSCNWIDPSGQIVRENRYQTREINKSVWDTFCRYQIGSATLTGTWQVKMFLENRQISDAVFEVK